jgi:WD40 repeat protein
MRALRVFRDETNLAVNPKLWSAIQAALAESKYFILLASPTAAVSPWVADEIAYWLRERSSETLLLIITDGEVQWDASNGDFDWKKTTAVPPSLQGAFSEVPRYLDFRWARQSEDLSLKNPRFLAAIADLAATLHGQSKDEIIGEDVRQHRTTKRMVAAVIATLMILLLSAIGGAMRAMYEANVALSREIAIRAMDQTDEPQLNVLLAVEAIKRAETTEAVQALRSGLRNRCQHILKGHTGSLLQASFSPDGKSVVTAGMDETARIWEVATGKLVLTLSGDTKGWVNRASFSSDSRFVVTAGPGNIARVWEVKTGNSIVLQGHTNVVRDAEFSRDGRYVVTAGWDGCVRVWNTGTGENRATFCYGTTIDRAVFSQDGDSIVTGGDFGARVWNVRTGSYVRLGPPDHINDVALSPDAKRVVTVAERTVRLWGTKTGKHISTLRGHSESVLQVAFSPDGQLIATASSDNTARLWEGKTGEEMAVLQGHTMAVRHVEFSPDSEWVVTASDDWTARVWRPLNGASRSVFQGHTSNVVHAGFSPDGRNVVTASNDTTARLWVALAGNEMARYSGHLDAVLDAAFGPESRWVVTSSDDGTARLWRSDTTTHLWRMQDHMNNPPTISQDGAWIVSAENDLWEVRTRKKLGRLKRKSGTTSANVTIPDQSTADALSPQELPESSQPFRVVPSSPSALNPWSRSLHAIFSTDGRWILVRDDEGASLWDMTIGRSTAILPVTWDVGAFSPDSRYIVTANYRTMAIWDVESGRQLASLPVHRGPIHDAQFSPSGKQVVSAGQDNTVRVWAVADGTQVVMQGHAGAVRRAQFSPNGKLIVSASEDQTVRVWEAATGRTLATLQNHRGPAAVARFSSEGQWLLTTDDNDALVWDTSTWRPIALFEGHTNVLRNATFSASKPWVLTASDDGTARVWKCELCTDTQGLLALAARRVSREVTDEERAIYLHAGPCWWSSGTFSFPSGCIR